ncbi:nuclear transport factor 2 family protein [Croceicoccus sp. BE223]|uniref:nuclear transport factor 2 family protein n=1 Tax=Croceicoccus sp. BE223 TaxID=2817716 RepID=UPI002866F5B3|nr:nuclear transport factor 2 family protein [Croceicoccus sp. BE223]MDR7103673.1 hypothetical protein [Croceicoccus sp. BE223]
MSPLLPHERSAVLDLLAAVKYAKDDEDASRFEACWSPEARLEICSNGTSMEPVSGREAIMAFYARVWQSGGHGKADLREVHVAEHPDIVRLSDSRLLARHAASFFYAEGGEPKLRGFGQFHDEIVFEDGAPRIALRRSTLIRR